jgi:hypothetical protein
MRIFHALSLLALTACGVLKKGESNVVTASDPATTTVAPTPSIVPGSFVKTTAEAPATRTIDVRDGLPHPQAMRILTDALSQRFTIDVVDPRAGFVMTAWQATLLRDGVPDLRYRTRLTARFLGDDWKKLQLRGEANWQRGEEWDVGYDVAQLDSVASDLRAKLGKKPTP